MRTFVEGPKICRYSLFFNGYTAFRMRHPRAALPAISPLGRRGPGPVTPRRHVAARAARARAVCPLPAQRTQPQVHAHALHSSKLSQPASQSSHNAVPLSSHLATAARSTATKGRLTNARRPADSTKAASWQPSANREGASGGPPRFTQNQVNADPANPAALGSLDSHPSRPPPSHIPYPPNRRSGSRTRFWVPEPAPLGLPILNL